MPTDSDMPEKIYLTDAEGNEHEIVYGEPLPDITFLDEEKFANGIYAAAQRYVDEMIDQLNEEHGPKLARAFSRAMVDFMHPLETEKMKRFLSNNFAKMHGIPMRRKTIAERKHIENDRPENT